MWDNWEKGSRTLKNSIMILMFKLLCFKLMKSRCMHQFFQIVSVGKHCDRRTQYSLCGLLFHVSTMEEYSTRRKRSSSERYLGVLPKKKPKPEPEENKFMCRVLLHNGLNLTLQLGGCRWKDVGRLVCKDT